MARLSKMHTDPRHVDPFMGSNFSQGASPNEGGGGLWVSIPESIEVLIAQKDIQGQEAAQTEGFPELAGAFKTVL